MYMNRKAGLYLLLPRHHGWRLSIHQHRGTPPKYYRRCVEFAWYSLVRTERIQPTTTKSQKKKKHLLLNLFRAQKLTILSEFDFPYPILAQYNDVTRISQISRSGVRDAPVKTFVWDSTAVKHPTMCVNFF